MPNVAVTSYTYTTEEVKLLQECVAKNGLASGLEVFLDMRFGDEWPSAKEVVGLWLRHAIEIKSRQPYFEDGTPVFTGEGVTATGPITVEPKVGIRDIGLRIKLIELCHKYGTGETDEQDGESVTQMVERLVKMERFANNLLKETLIERDEARAELAKLKNK